MSDLSNNNITMDSNNTVPVIMTTQCKPSGRTTQSQEAPISPDTISAVRRTQIPSSHDQHTEASSNIPTVSITPEKAESVMDLVSELVETRLKTAECSKDNNYLKLLTKSQSQCIKYVNEAAEANQKAEQVGLQNQNLVLELAEVSEKGEVMNEKIGWLTEKNNLMDKAIEQASEISQLTKDKRELLTEVKQEVVEKGQLTNEKVEWLTEKLEMMKENARLLTEVKQQTLENRRLTKENLELWSEVVETTGG